MSLSRQGFCRCNLNEHRIRQTKERCEELKAVTLLEVDGEAINTLIREPPRLVIFFDPLTPTDIHRVPLNLYMRVTSPMSVVACLDHLPPLPPTRDSSHPLCFFFRHRSNRGAIVISIRNQIPGRVCSSGTPTSPASFSGLQRRDSILGVIQFCPL